MTTAHIRTLGRRDIVLFTVSAILLLDTLAAAAAVGPAAISWWLILGVIFYLPFASICAELGCAYPQQGGIYAWVRDAFGRRWGARVSWCYWINTAVWIPAIFILFAGVFKQLFFPDLSMAWQIGISIALVWVAMLVNVVTLQVGKWVPNLGAIFKVVIFLLIMLGAWQYSQENGMANELTLETLSPQWSESLKYIPAIIYGMLGFELVSASAEEMKNPQRDVPLGIFVSGVIIITLYLFGTASILTAIPAEDVNLVEGLVDTLRMLFEDSYGNAFVILLGVGALYTFFSNGVTWGMGSNRAACEAAQAGELPAFLGKSDARRGTPVGAAIVMGVVASSLLLLYGFLAGSNEELFWNLFAFSAVIFILPYIVMVFAFLYLRQRDAQHKRPYKVPFGDIGAKVAAMAVIIVLTLAIILFMYTPGEGAVWEVILGALLTIGFGEFAIRRAEKHIHYNKKRR
ncbi:MAG: APC family permease [Gammaproteobacteria bacterium]|nr:APC family permease [Gammaproteobacteria bacterium]